jgi:hypothetical protein
MSTSALTLKIKLKQVAYFSAEKSVRQLTTFTTHFTTTSPQKDHVLHALFPKTPCKTSTPPQQKNICV